MTGYASYFKAYPSHDDPTFLGKLFSERAKIRLATQWLQIGSLQTIHPLPRIKLGKAKGDSTEKKCSCHALPFPFSCIFWRKEFRETDACRKNGRRNAGSLPPFPPLLTSYHSLLKQVLEKPLPPIFFSKSVCEQFCGIGFRKRITTYFFTRRVIIIIAWETLVWVDEAEKK